MKFRIAPAVFLAAAASIALAACGSTDDASTEAEADTVEFPADEAMADVEEAPVVDAGANAALPAGEDDVTATEAEAIEEAGDDAAATAEAAADAMTEDAQ